MIDTTIKLISEEITKNEYGAPISTKSEREVFCQCRSVGRADFYNGMQNGLALEYVFVTNPVNYNGEKELEYDGELYAVTRTYKASLDELEIYAGTKVGVAYGSDETDQPDTH